MAVGVTSPAVACFDVVAKASLARGWNQPQSSTGSGQLPLVSQAGTSFDGAEQPAWNP